jgi:DNA-binding transcriptional LysR family regulator
VELRQLRHFVALAEERSVTAAARRELIVQSGLSHSIQSLERELGTELYLRGTRPVRLTSAGEALLNPAREALNAATAAERAVHETRDVLVGRLRMGVSLSAQHVVPFAGYLADFLRVHPGVDVQMRMASALAMQDMVDCGELDCAIGPALEQRGRLRLTPLGAEPLLLTCRADHPLALRDGLRVSDLDGERFVDVPPGWVGRLLSDAMFAGAGITRRIVAEVGDWELFLELVTAGVGIGFAPVGLPFAGLGRPGGPLRQVQVEGVAMERHLYLILPPKADTSPVAARFADAILTELTARGDLQAVSPGR